MSPPQRWAIIEHKHAEGRVIVEPLAPQADDQPQRPEQPQRKRKEGGGRDESFEPKHKAALRREYRRYKKTNRGALKKVAQDHLRDWAKEKFGIKCSRGTVNTHIMMPVDKPRK